MATAMKRLSGFLVVALLGIAGGAARAQAPSPADAAEKWGLIGTWALNCSQPASKDNLYMTYERQDRSLAISRNLGGFKDVNFATKAWITERGELEMIVHFKAFSKVMTSLLAKIDADRFHTVSNRDQDGTYTIREAKFTRDGVVAPSMARCSAAR